jgi:cytochrome c2
MTSALAVCLLSVSVASADARKGEEFFNSMQGGDCKSCHRVDGSKLVGPGLANVMTRHSNEWLKAFLTDPQATWKSEDPETLELKKRVLKTRVPFTVCKKGPMTSDQLQDLIDYLATLDK